MVVVHQPESFGFSTDGLSAQVRMRAIRGLRDRDILPIEPLPGRRVHLNIAKWSLPSLAILSGSLAGVRQEGTVTSARDDLFFAVNVAGGGIVTQQGREIRPTSGDAFVVNTAAGPFAVSRPTRAQFVGLRVPRHAIAPLVRPGADESLRLIPGTSDRVTLLASYLRALLSGRVLSAAETSRVVVTHVHDLIALSLGASRDGTDQAEDRSVPAARLRAIKSDIVANLEDDALTIGAVAARHGVTSRYVHRLFEREGVTYTQFVLHQRLERAYRMLRDQRLGTSTISSIAYEVGFGDLSYFNRVFRRQYHRTPSDVRNGEGF